MKLLISAFFFATFQRFALSDVDFHRDKCSEYNPQNELDVELIEGLWFGSEMITHAEGRGVRTPEFESCVIVQIDLIKEWDDYNYDYDENSVQNGRRYDYHPKRYRFIKLQWNEHDRSAEYTLKFNSTRRGLWIGTEPPKGSVLRKHLMHTHYTGTVQVMKAVGNHLVLTFCEKGEIFTIILTRIRNVLAVDAVESVHDLLNRRGLAILAVRDLCRHNSAIRVTIQTTLVFTLMTMLLMAH